MNGCHYPNELFSQATQRNSNSNNQRKKLSLFGYFIYSIRERSQLLSAAATSKRDQSIESKQLAEHFFLPFSLFSLTLSLSLPFSPSLSSSLLLPSARCQQSICWYSYLKLLRFFTDLECSLLEDLGKVSLSSFVSEDTILVELTSVSLLHSCNLLPMFSYPYLCQD